MRETIGAPRAGTEHGPGFTVLEMVVSIAILGAVFALALSSLSSSQSYARASLLKGLVEGGARRTLMVAADRLRETGTDPAAELALTLPHTSGGVTRYHLASFRPNQGMDPATSAITWGPVHSVGFAYEPGEASGGTAIAVNGSVIGRSGGTPNGRDDDGDGLIDEGIFYYQYVDGGGQTRYEVTAGDVLPASGMTLLSGATTPNPEGDVVVIHVETARRDPTAPGGATIDSDPGRFFRATVESQAVPRNISN